VPVAIDAVPERGVLCRDLWYGQTTRPELP
jgi:hypothetical protein